MSSFFTALDFFSITSHIHNWVLLLLQLHLFILSGVISPLISSSILGTYQPGEFNFQCPIFCLFILDWKKLVFIPISKKGNAKEHSNYHTIAVISHASKVTLKILQTRLQQYMNHEPPDVQAGFRKGRGTRDQIANICWIIEKAREFQKNIYFCFIDYAKDFDCVDQNKLWKILQEMGIPDHLTCLLRNLYAGQEAKVRSEHGTTGWFQIGKGVRQGCILSPC